METLDSYGVMRYDDIFKGGKKSLQGTAQVDLGEYGFFNLELQETALFDTNYQLSFSSSTGIRKSNKSTTRSYIGTVAGNSSSVVSLTVSENFIYGFIRTAKEEINIEPLRYYDSSADKDELITYLTKDQTHSHSMHCGLDKKLEAQFLEHINQVKETKSTINGCLEVDMSIASDFSMFEFYGSVEEVENHAIAILNAVQTNYDTEFNDEIKFNLVEQFISTCDTCDPWTSSVDSETCLLYTSPSPRDRG